MTDTFEVVCYAHPTPKGLASLTLMGLLFDRVHFPGVYIPRDLDLDVVGRELKRLEALPDAPDLDGLHMRACMRMALIRSHIDDFCIFTGDPKDVFGTVDEQTPALYEKLRLTIFGPDPPGFTPFYIPGHHKGFPGHHDGLGIPSALVYAANALIYAARNDLPIINEEPWLPVVEHGTSSDAQLEKALTAVAALEALRLVMPAVPIMRPESLREFRAVNADALKRFRFSMTRCSRELIAALRDGADENYVTDLAAKIADQDIRPTLEDLRTEYSRQGTSWYEDLANCGSAVASVASAYYAPTASAAAVVALLAISPLLVGMQKEKDRKAELRNKPLFYLLSIEKALKK